MVYLYPAQFFLSSFTLFNMPEKHKKTYKPPSVIFVIDNDFDKWICVLVDLNSFFSTCLHRVIRVSASMKHVRPHALKNSCFRWVCYLLSCTEFLEFQQLSWDPGFPLYERDGTQVLEKTQHVLAPLWAVLLNQRNVEGKHFFYPLNL